MNKHFEDSLYYLTRAAEHAKLGVETELEPVAARVRELVGREAKPEPARLERVRSAALEHRTTRKARETLANARTSVSRGDSSESTA